MAGLIGGIQIHCRGGTEYQREGEALTALYGQLLGMRRAEVGYIAISKEDGTKPQIGFENDRGPDDPDARPAWPPDPDHPQQAHLEIEVGDLDLAEELILGLGATQLQNNGDHRIYADHASHPFHVSLDPQMRERPEGPLPGRLARVVFDCFSPRSLAVFYEELLDMRTRVVDTPERVVIAGTKPDALMLGFEHAQFVPARWPDPAYPPQIHLDLSFEEREPSEALAEKLGAIRLPAMGGSAPVYADPASHIFCLGGPGD